MSKLFRLALIGIIVLATTALAPQAPITNAATSGGSACIGTFCIYLPIIYKNVFYTITPSAGANGTISPSTPQSVLLGSSITFTITPNSNYVIAGVLVDGNSVGTPNTYTFNNVTAAHTIAASFGYACPGTSGNTYSQNTITRAETPPLRPAEIHADKNFALRGFITITTQAETLIAGQADPGEPHQPPQIGTIFNPDRVTMGTANITEVYHTYLWNWGTPPNDPGTRGGEDSNPDVGVLGLAATPGEVLQVPTSYYEIAFVSNVHYQAFVMYADADTVALHYSAEDSVVNGYTVHIDNICTDPNLLAHYNTLDGGGTGPRYNNTSFNMPYVALGQPIGVARSSIVRVKVIDSGSTIEPRMCWNLWHWSGQGAGNNQPCNP